MSVPKVTILEVAKQGPRGPEGPAGSNEPLLVVSAGQVLSGHRMVYLDTSQEAVLADKDDLSAAFGVVGLTLNAAMAGADVQIATGAKVEHAGWNWAPGSPLFLADDGNLTQTPPVAGSFLLVVGFAIDPTSIWIAIERPIFIS